MSAGSTGGGGSDGGRHRARGGDPTAAERRGSKVWINPVGGLGDTLMVSGVLKQVIERMPEKRFHLVRRPGYMSLLAGHPAIAGTGFPPPDAEIITTDYWNHGPLGPGSQRPMQILGRMFGLRGEVEERLYLEEQEEEGQDSLAETIPWASTTIAVSPGTVSPRKRWPHRNWERLCAALREEGAFIIQFGDRTERHVRFAYSILGLTRPKEVFSLLRRSSLLVSVDCFLIHAAHYVGLPTVALWGPTRPEAYGYPEQVHVRAKPTCDWPKGCIVPGRPENYNTLCPLDADQCMAQLSVSQVYQAANRALASG